MLYADRPLPDQCWPLHTSWMANLLILQSCLRASPRLPWWLWWVVTVFLGVTELHGRWRVIKNPTNLYRLGGLHCTVWRASRYTSPAFTAVISSILTLMIGSRRSPWPLGRRAASFCFNKHHNTCDLREKGWKNLEDFTGVNSSSERPFVQD